MDITFGQMEQIQINPKQFPMITRKKKLENVFLQSAICFTTEKAKKILTSSESFIQDKTRKN